MQHLVDQLAPALTDMGDSRQTGPDNRQIFHDDISTLEAKDQSGKPLMLIARDDLPPKMTTILALLETMFRQAAGAMGAGAKVFVFDPGGVNSCRPGGLAVSLAGETYTWQTPIPCSATSTGTVLWQRL
ncbi:MAG TPA: hypothetical protein VGJ20_30335 [Xanthobacteraceae bacterium]